MSALRGRLVVVTRNALVVGGARTKSLKINGSPIDITSDDDAGVRNLLAQPGQVEVDITVSGILVNDNLVQEALSTTNRSQTTSFSFSGGWVGSPDHLTLSGTFFMDSFEVGAEYKDAVTFTASFKSSGAITLGG